MERNRLHNIGKNLLNMNAAMRSGLLLLTKTAANGTQDMILMGMFMEIGKF